MSYANQQAMTDRFGTTELEQLTDHDNTGGINTTVLGQALKDADAEIDGHLQGRYTLPLTVVPEVIVTYACDITRYRLYDDRVTDQVRRRYEDAMKFLRNVADGKISLGLDAGGEEPPAVGGVAVDAAERVFTRGSLADFL